jgi:uncharacterized protein YdeI (YjbR/CyaY-like superfamily)
MTDDRASNDLPRLTFRDAEAFDEWLAEHHATSPGIWMLIAKAAAEEVTVSWKDAVPVALRWGWIDSQRRSLDSTHFLQRWTPRRARSVWSRINVEHCERLIAEGRMMPAGMAQVEAAKADGRWAAAYTTSSVAEVPAELQAHLDADPKLAEAFAALDSRNRTAMIYRIQSVKRAETRERKAAQFAEMLRTGERIH